MTVRSISEPILDAEERFEAFENLMPFRVQNILLVSSLYDSFILREDGRLNELLIDESLELNLRQIPSITHVSSCAEAVELAKSNPQFNLIVTNLAVGDMNAAQLAREVRRAGLHVPVVVLGYDYREIKNFVARNPVTDIDRVFLWQGTARILIAIVKYIEDKRNVLHDTRAMGVPPGTSGVGCSVPTPMRRMRPVLTRLIMVSDELVNAACVSPAITALTATFSTSNSQNSRNLAGRNRPTILSAG